MGRRGAADLVLLKPYLCELSSLAAVLEEGIGGVILARTASNRAEAAADVSRKKTYSLFTAIIERDFARVNNSTIPFVQQVCPFRSRERAPAGLPGPHHHQAVKLPSTKNRNSAEDMKEPYFKLAECYYFEKRRSCANFTEFGSFANFSEMLLR